MSLRVAEKQLRDAHAKLSVRWSDASARWADATSERFRRDYLEPAEPRLRRASTAMERMAMVVAQVRSECE